MVFKNRRFRRLLHLPQRLSKRFMTGLLRALMISNRPDRLAQSGFVLPTTVLLLLVVTLTAGALTYRSFSRSDQVIALREQQVIQNAATPAIDRAKAKLEYLFKRDLRIPGGLPSSDLLIALMKNDNTDPDLGVISEPEDIYTLPDETRIDLNNDGIDDNAWWFRTDINGDGTVDDDEVIAYSILTDDADDGILVTDPVSREKAEALITRTGPLAASELSNRCAAARSPEGGWQIVNASQDLVQKNFQVDAIVLKRDGERNGSFVNRTVDTLEFQQSREANRGSKWGAWFDYDLDVYPGAEFKWNGAMHTESNLIVRRDFQGYMVSSNDSCIYSRTASEITLNEGTGAVDPSSGEVDFQGELVFGSIIDDDFGNGGGGRTPRFHVYDGNNVPDDDGVRINGDNDDSVRRIGGNVTPYDIAVNPVTLYTEGRHEHITARGASTWEDDGVLDENLAVANNKAGGRIYNNDERTPFVDDFFRADNRWGPNPTYGPGIDLNEEKGNTDPEIVVGYTIDPTAPTVIDPVAAAEYDQLTDEQTGLDGYWERQAILTGLRLIVGERLQLGNAFGWNSIPTTVVGLGVSVNDPLYPPDDAKGNVGTPKASHRPGRDGEAYSGGIHEVIQRRSLQDNLAAVQSMAVYHYEGDPSSSVSNGEFPLACLALTSHPGTLQSIINSRTFENYPGGSLKADFLHGEGTNGWEFGYNPAFDTESAFATQYNSSTSSLRKALTNLAYFAGDPLGGAPSFQVEQDVFNSTTDPGFVHPFPYLAMWGDFSALRRIVDEDYGSVNYADLSIADKSTLHTAACTLGVLAYNLDSLRSAYNDSSNNATIQSIASTLLRTVGSTEIPDEAAARTVTTEEWLAAAALPPAEEALARAIADYFQVLRDRTFGFKSGAGLEADVGTTFGVYTQVTGTFNLNAVSGPYSAGNYSVSCDPNRFRTEKSITTADQALTLALALCPKPNSNDVKYPSLYYLFPRASHDQGLSADATALAFLGIDDTAQPPGEEYIDETVNEYLPDGANPVNDGISYEVIGASPDDLSTLAAVARVPGVAGATGWRLPSTADSTAVLDDSTNNRPDDKPFAINNRAGGTLDVPFLDKGMFDGREQLNERVLDIDISALASDLNIADYWLSNSNERNGEGLVFAYREDAISEPEIVRPRNVAANFADCTTIVGKQFNLETNANCQMRVEPGVVLQDPPLSESGFSLKPVDFIPDPMRRSYGFRFRNGADFSNNNQRDHGMTFVTDNSVYVQADEDQRGFNLHSDDGTRGGLLEEFDNIVLTNTPGWGVDEFYSNGNAGRDVIGINTDEFAALATDHWRPVEILADMVGLLSSEFRDGSILDGFTSASDTTGLGEGESSYQNQNRPYFETGDEANFEHDDWVTQDETDNTPVWVDRNGVYRLKTDRTPIDTNGYNMDRIIAFANEDARSYNVQEVTQANTINATFVSGIIPSRPQQGNGGFHNFPRFNEWWEVGNDPTTLNIAGAFLQLKFTTAATAPYDQDGWEPDDVLDNDEYRFNYQPPERAWGYDVGLQYVPAAPVSRRFVNFGSPRSEYYRELPIDDPYITLLRCAEVDLDGDGVNDDTFDPSVDDNSCPASP